MAQGFGTLGKLGGEIGGLSEILLEVVEFERFVVVELDEFPVAVADGGSGGPGGAVVVGIVPEEGARGFA